MKHAILGPLAALALLSIAPEAMAQANDEVDAMAVSVKAASICEQANKMTAMNNYNDGKRGKAMLEGTENCLASPREDLTGFYKTLLARAKTKAQKEALMSWRAEWSTVLDGMALMQPVSTEAAMRAGTRVKLAFE